MEAAIGIEPMNKGFAVRADGSLPIVTHRHTTIFIDCLD